MVFLLKLNKKKKMFWQEDWALVFNSNKLLDFRDFFWFSKILSLKSFCKSGANLCITNFITNNFVLVQGKFGKTSKNLKIYALVWIPLKKLTKEFST